MLFTVIYIQTTYTRYLYLEITGLLFTIKCPHILLDYHATWCYKHIIMVVSDIDAWFRNITINFYVVPHAPTSASIPNANEPQRTGYLIVQEAGTNVLVRSKTVHCTDKSCGSANKHVKIFI